MDLPKRKEIRLKEYDYASNGVYFVTICTKGREHILSTIRVGGTTGLARTNSAFWLRQNHSGATLTPDAPVVELSAFGKIVENEIIRMNDVYDNVKANDYVIMPNHIHLIIMIDKNGRSGAPAPTRANAIIPRYISTLKRFTNKKCNIDLWQRSYYDHIIRDEADYIEKRNYIKNNPAKWAEDEYF